MINWAFIVSVVLKSGARRPMLAPQALLRQSL